MRRSRVERPIFTDAAALDRPASSQSDDHAELFAASWRTARDLTLATGGDVSALGRPVRLALASAGDRALATHARRLQPPTAMHIVLWPDDVDRLAAAQQRIPATSRTTRERWKPSAARTRHLAEP